MDDRLRYCVWATSNPDKWRKIVWTDEKLLRLSHFGKKHVWILPGYNEYAQYVHKGSADKHTRQVWASMSFDTGISRLTWLHGRQNRWTYVDRLKEAFEQPPYINNVDNEQYFMQDNCKYHTAKFCQDYLVSVGRRPIFWPARSPDLNPIEYVWGFMERWLDTHRPSIHTEGQWERAIALAWEAATTKERLEGYMERCWINMHRCLLQAGGNKYREA